MQNKMRKVLAVLACLAMLCTVLPMGALIASAAETPVLSKDFEDGQAGFTAGSVVAEGPNGSNCLKWSASGGWSSTYVTINGVEKNADYVITFKAKSTVDGPMGITIQNAGWGSYYAEYFNVTTEWKDYTIETNVADHPTASGGIMFKFQDQGKAMDLYIDDLVMVKKGADAPVTPDPEPEDEENLLKNGGFESELDNWENVWGSCTVSFVDGREGGKALNFASGLWNMVRQKQVAVEPYTDYVYTAWAKDADGLTFLVKDGGDSGNIAETFAEPGSEWKQYTVEFNSHEFTSINICLMGSKEASSAIIDDVRLVKAAGTEPEVPADSKYEYAQMDGIRNWTEADAAAMDGFGSTYSISNEGLVGDATQSIKMTATGNNTRFCFATREANGGPFSTKNPFKMTNAEDGKLSDYDGIAIAFSDAEGKEIEISKFTARLMRDGDDWSSYWNFETNYTDIDACYIDGYYHLSFADYKNLDAAGIDALSIMSVLFYRDIKAGDTAYISDIKAYREKDSEPEVPVTPAVDNLLTNGDFETGDISGWTNSSDVKYEMVAGNNSANAVKITGGSRWNCLIQYIDVEKNTDYVLNWYAKDCSGITVLVKGANGNIVETQPSGSEWAAGTLEFNSGDLTQVRIMLMLSTANGNDTGIFDDIVLYKKGSDEPGDEPGDEPEIGNSLDEGFEDGLGSWKVIGTGGSGLYTTDAHTGTNSILVQGPNAEDYSNAMASAPVAVKAGHTYTVSYWAKTIKTDSNGASAIVANNYSNPDGTGKLEVLIPTDWPAYSSSWKEYTKTFTPAKDGYAIVEFYRINADTLYDDVKIVDNNPDQPDNPDIPDIENLVTNGFFETGSNSGWTVYSGSTVKKEAAKEGSYGMHLVGEGGWGTMAAQTVPVTGGREYLVTMWLKANSNGTNVQVKDGSNGGTNMGGCWFTDTEWLKLEFTVTPQEDAIFINFCGGGNGIATSLYLDSVIIAPTGTAPSGPQELVVNGDFETGDASSWNTYQQTKVSTEAAFEGKYGLIAKGDGGWGGLLNQTFALEPNTDYLLCYAVKAVHGGLNIQVRNAANDANLYYTYTNVDKCPEWTKVEAVFNSGDNTSGKFNLVGSGTNGANGDELWFDNISVTKVGGDEEEIVPNNLFSGVKTSVRDDIFGTKGLAFRFELAASGAEILANNQYVASSATIVPDSTGTAYKLVKAGAIVTNDATVGEGDMTLDSVNGKKVINIAAKYLCDVGKKDLSFAVRVVGIPDAGLDTNIFARPYYVYKDADGKEVVIYGNVQSDNYNHVKSPKASIKILAIGNSFSQDAMNNHLYQVLESAGYQEIVLGNMYIGGCDLNTHWTNINNDRGAYTFYKTSDGKWKQTSSYKVSTAIAEEDWDYITIQQASPSSGQPATYSSLDKIVSYIDTNKTNPNAKILWHMTWAYDEVNQNSGYGNYGNNQMKMYTSILNTVAEKVLTNDKIDGVIPAGTSIQNMRTSTLKASLLCEGDGYHLSSNYGDYIAALTWYAYISGDDVSTLKYQPSVIADYRDEVNDAVMGAIDDPYQVTKADTYDTTKSIKVLSIGHSFSRDVMVEYLYDMLEAAGYEDITIGYLYYPGCSLSRHWEYISENKNGHEQYGKNNSGKWVTKSNPYAIDVLRDEDWDVVTLQASPDYVGGENKEYSYIPGITDWIEENAINANVEIKWHMIWAYSTDCELWSNMYHKDPATGKYSQTVMYDNIIKATNQYIVTDSTFTGIIPVGTAVQNGRTSFIGDNFNEPVVPGTQADGYHLNKKYGDFTGSLTWACYFSGKDANEINVRSSGMTEEEFKAIAEAVNNALKKPLELTESSFK